MQRTDRSVNTRAEGVTLEVCFGANATLIEDNLSPIISVEEVSVVGFASVKRFVRCVRLDSTS